LALQLFARVLFAFIAWLLLLLKEAPDTLVRLLALFSFQRSTVCCRSNFYILSIRQGFVNIFLQVS
uniref:hypothetical protein n=1 Tax=Tetragenococcus halophilus TaxID=51669 RepID=UPI0024E18651